MLFFPGNYLLIISETNNQKEMTKFYASGFISQGNRAISIITTANLYFHLVT